MRLSERVKTYREEYERVSQRMNGLFYKGFDATEIAEFEEQLKKIIQNLEGQ